MKSLYPQLSPTLAMRFCTVSLCAISILFTGCDYASEVKVPPSHTVTQQSFEQIQGLQLPYPLYAPSSMLAWELGDRTRFRFNPTTHTYVYEGVPITAPVIDSQGPRFKICSDYWDHQLGFGNRLSRDEATFGVSTEGTILKLEFTGDSGSDLRFEYAKSDLAKLSASKMRLEVKVTRLKPTPEGYLRASLY